MSTPVPVQPNGSPEKASVWEDFVDILYAPSQVFARRENGNFWIPLLVVTLLLGFLWMAAVRVLEPVMDAEWNRQMQRMLERNPGMDPAQMEAGRSIAEKFQTIGVFVIVPVSICLIALVTWLVGKLFEAKLTVRTAFVVASFAYVPRVIGSILTIAEGLIRDPASLDGYNRLVWGVARFLDPDTTPPALLAMLTRIDLFTIWVTVLLAIGLAVTGRIDRKRAAVAGVVLWLVGAVPAILGALRA